jgi:transcription elongation factor Elf1
MKHPIRLATCQACGHQGGVLRTVPTDAKLRCSACGAVSRVRQCIGDRPAPRRAPSRQHSMRRQAAQEVIQRYGGDAPLNDNLEDLWQKKTNSVESALKPGQIACPKCGRKFKVRLQCPKCRRPVSRRDLGDDSYLHLKHEVKLKQRTRHLRLMPMELLGLWVGRSRQRRRLALAARGLPDDYQFPNVVPELRRLRRLKAPILPE